MKKYILPLMIIPFLIVYTGCSSGSIKSESNSGTKKIIGYIFPTTDTIDTTKIAINQLSHINFAFAKISENKMTTGYSADSFNITLLKQHIRNTDSSCKLLISVGGWGFSDQFSDVALTHNSRDTFIQSALEYLRYFDLDGIDVDWEYPGQAGKTNNFRKEDKTNFTLLLKDLRQALDSLEQTDGKHYLTSVAIPCFHAFYENVETSEIIKYLDYINLMAYDFYGEWEPVSGHQSNLYSTKNPKSLSADSAVNNLAYLGIPEYKIVLGIPFYSRSWKITDLNKNSDINNYGYGAGINSNYEELKANYIEKNGFVSCWDSLAAVPYLWNDSLKIFVTYENPLSIRKKCNYINQHNLAGAMFWKYNLEQKNVLLDVLSKELKY